jgi:hypothetical protein
MANPQRECFVREVTKLVCSFNEVLDMVEIVGVLEMLKYRLLSACAAKAAEPVPQQTTRKGTPQKKRAE